MDLVEFLRARLDKDEQVARACAGEPWAATPAGTVHIDTAPNAPTGVLSGDAPDSGTAGSGPAGGPAGGAACGSAGGEGTAGEGYVASAENTAYAEFIARHNPARALREVAALRRIVDEYEKGAWLLEQGRRSEAAEAAHSARLRVLRVLALPYAHHPDYRDEWRP